MLAIVFTTKTICFKNLKALLVEFILSVMNFHVLLLTETRRKNIETLFNFFSLLNYDFWLNVDAQKQLNKNLIGTFHSLQKSLLIGEFGTIKISRFFFIFHCLRYLFSLFAMSLHGNDIFFYKIGILVANYWQLKIHQWTIKTKNNNKKKSIESFRQIKNEIL